MKNCYTLLCDGERLSSVIFFPFCLAFLRKIMQTPCVRISINCFLYCKFSKLQKLKEDRENSLYVEKQSGNQAWVVIISNDNL